MRKTGLREIRSLACITVHDSRTLSDKEDEMDQKDLQLYRKIGEEIENRTANGQSPGDALSAVLGMFSGVSEEVIRELEKNFLHYLQDSFRDPSPEIENAVLTKKIYCD